MQVIEKPWGREEVVEINEKYMDNEVDTTLNVE